MPNYHKPSSLVCAGLQAGFGRDLMLAYVPSSICLLLRRFGIGFLLLVFVFIFPKNMLLRQRATGLGL